MLVGLDRDRNRHLARRFVRSAHRRHQQATWHLHGRGEGRGRGRWRALIQRLHARLPKAQYASLLLERARIYAQAGEERLALADVRDALRRTPHHAEVRPLSDQHLVHAAEVFLLIGYHEKAQRVFRAAEKHATSEDVRQSIARLRRRIPSTSATAHDTPAPFALPAEIVLRVFGYLDLATLHAVTSVCRAWRQWAIRHGPLWHTIVVRSSSAAVPDKVRVQRQTALLRMYLHRAGPFLRHLALSSPLTDTPGVHGVLHGTSLTELQIGCHADHAAAWVHTGTQCPSLVSLSIRTHGATAHPWLAPPLALDEAVCPPLKRLALHGTPPLGRDEGTLRLCRNLVYFAYSAPPSPADLRRIREAHAETVSVLAQHAHATLEALELDGIAIWAMDMFAFVSLPAVSFPVLRTLQAPLKSILPRAWRGAKDVLPQLTSLSMQVSLPRTPGATSASLLRFAFATRATLRHATLRITRDSATWIVECLLRIWHHLESLSVVWDEAVHTDAPALERVEEQMQRPLTGALLVALLTPGALGRDRVLCPALHTLAIGTDTTLRGRELAEMVAMRILLAQRCTVATARAALAQKKLVAEPEVEHALAVPWTHLDLRGCMELQPEPLVFLRAHAHVQWSAHEVERARHAQRARERVR